MTDLLHCSIFFALLHCHHRPGSTRSFRCYDHRGRGQSRRSIRVRQWEPSDQTQLLRVHLAIHIQDRFDSFIKGGPLILGGNTVPSDTNAITTIVCLADKDKDFFAAISSSHHHTCSLHVVDFYTTRWEYISGILNAFVCKGIKCKFIKIRFYYVLQYRTNGWSMIQHITAISIIDSLNVRYLG